MPGAFPAAGRRFANGGSAQLQAAPTWCLMATAFGSPGRSDGQWVATIGWPTGPRCKDPHVSFPPEDPLMSKPQHICPDCAGESSWFEHLSRREFLKTAGAAAVASTAQADLAKYRQKPPETLVKKLYDSLTDAQRSKIAFEWDHLQNGKPLRTRVANNWHITSPEIRSNFYTQDQQDMIRALFEGLFNPEWVPRLDKQLQDDAGGWGRHQNVAIFGKPGEDKFILVMTGRHMTIRCDGNSVDHMAFGGPIFHGHAASGFNEKPDHPGNVFWPQAIEANNAFEMLDGKQRKLALVARTPAENAVGFRGPDGQFPGIPITELSSDQKEQLEKTLRLMLDPYREADRDEAIACLKGQGGLDACSLAFYQQGDLGDDGVWDNWRLEGPSFVWYFRGSPHVHLWINISADHSVETNA
jgi:hypothetical protein